MALSPSSPPGARLASVLQQLKQRTGLSLARLASATTFSKSSWERYLNGKTLPPRSAVKELCRLAGEPADHPLALLDIARTDNGTRTEHPPAIRPDTPPASTPPASAPPASAPPASATARVGHRRATVLTALASACAVVLGTLVLLHLPASHREETSPSPASPRPTGVLCRHTACQDKDPIGMNCAADPSTLAEQETATGAWIQIRYSRECGTAWVRMWAAAVNDRVELRTDGRDDSLHDARVRTRTEADTYVHTLMSAVAPGTPVQACFLPAAGGRKECLDSGTDRTVPTGQDSSGPVR
jgi:transcriptional regulator with XRE-family HTH domain